MMSGILTFEGRAPRIDPSAWIAPTAVVIGDVEIGAGSSVWFHCVLRGDTNFIRIGGADEYPGRFDPACEPQDIPLHPWR